MVNSKPVTSIYGLERSEYDSFKQLVKEKLGISPNACVVQMIRSKIGELSGKPVIAGAEAVKVLQSRLTSLTRQQDEIRKILEEHHADWLIDLAANDEYDIDFDPPQKAKRAIGKLIQDFKAGKINASRNDFQSLITLAELTMESEAILNNLEELRVEAYTTSQNQNPVAEAAQQPEPESEPVKQDQEETQEENQEDPEDTDDEDDYDEERDDEWTVEEE